jgi:hypothetical protein
MERACIYEKSRQITGPAYAAISANYCVARPGATKPSRYGELPAAAFFASYLLVLVANC